MARQRTSWRNTGSAFLLSVVSLILSSHSFAAVKHIPAPPPASQINNSLAGWNGDFTTCLDGSPPPCWNELQTTPYMGRPWRGLASLGGGAVLSSHVGQSTNFPIRNPQTDEFFNYSAERPEQTGAIFEVFLGTEWSFSPHFALDLGIDLDQVATNYRANGHLQQGADLQSANRYNYNYSATTRQVLAEGKLLYQIAVLHPYLLVGAGAAFNTAYNFNTSVPPNLTFTRQYNDNTATSFTYALGFGLDFDVAAQLRLGLGYRYTDLGEIQLGQASIDNTPVSGAITQTHMHTNMILAQLTLLL